MYDEIDEDGVVAAIMVLLVLVVVLIAGIGAAIALMVW